MDHLLLSIVKRQSWNKDIFFAGSYHFPFNSLSLFSLLKEKQSRDVSTCPWVFGLCNSVRKATIIFFLLSCSATNFPALDFIFSKPFFDKLSAQGTFLGQNLS